MTKRTFVKWAYQSPAETMRDQCPVPQYTAVSDAYFYSAKNCFSLSDEKHLSFRRLFGGFWLFRWWHTTHLRINCILRREWQLIVFRLELIGLKWDEIDSHQRVGSTLDPFFPVNQSIRLNSIRLDYVDRFMNKTNMSFQSLFVLVLVTVHRWSFVWFYYHERCMFGEPT